MNQPSGVSRSVIGRAISLVCHIMISFSKLLCSHPILLKILDQISYDVSISNVLKDFIFCFF